MMVSRVSQALLTAALIAVSFAHTPSMAQNSQRTSYRGYIRDDDDRRIGTLILTFKGDQLEGFTTLANGKRVTTSKFRWNNRDYEIGRAVLLLGTPSGWPSSETPDEWKGKIDFTIHPKSTKPLPPTVGVGRIFKRDKRSVYGEFKMASDQGGAYRNFTAKFVKVD